MFDFSGSVNALPVTLAFQSNLHLKRKLELLSVFGLTLIITMFAALRYGLDAPWDNTVPRTWTRAWGHIEQSITIMVVCLVSFRSMAIHHNRNREQRKRNRLFLYYFQQNRNRRPVRPADDIDQEGMGFSVLKSEASTSSLRHHAGPTSSDSKQTAPASKPANANQNGSSTTSGQK